jgi:hypothetical protein
MTGALPDLQRLQVPSSALHSVSQLTARDRRIAGMTIYRTAADPT